MRIPRTSGCIVCGRDNQHGLRLNLSVDETTGVVSVPFTPRPEHIGFIGIVHGGVISTVIDEAMVWAATWAGRRFCVCGELTVRFKSSARVGQTVRVLAKVDSSRPRLIVTSAEVVDEQGNLIATGSGKYVPLSPEQNREFVGTLVDEPETAQAAEELRSAAG
jgi:uncharacterized protein (TIGR00369 family)